MKDTTKIQITARGYYNAPNSKMCLLSEGEILEVVGRAPEKELRDGWECLNSQGKTVFVEFENCTSTT